MHDLRTVYRKAQKWDLAVGSPGFRATRPAAMGLLGWRRKRKHANAVAA